MEYEELQHRAINAKSRQDQDYWEGWMAEIEWSQFISALAIVQDWDAQLIEMIKQGYLPDHPLAPLYSPEAMLEGRAT